MSVTVVIPTHNRRAGLTGLLDDLRRQDTAAAPEVIVVDSPAGEDVGDVVNAARSRGLDVRRILTENRIAAKRNAGAEEARGELLCFLDDDMRLPGGWLAAHVDAQARRPGACVCGGVRFPDAWVASSNYYRFKAAQHRDGAGSTLVPLPAQRIVTMNLSLPRAVFLATGGFDPEFTRYGGEDIEYGFRLARAGVPLLLDAAAWAWHEEVRLDLVRWCRKVYDSAYAAPPLVLAKAPEARRVSTFRYSEPGLQTSPRDRTVRAAVRALARPTVVGGLPKLLRRTDRISWLYHRAAFQAATVLANQRAVDDRAAGRPNRAGELFG